MALPLLYYDDHTYYINAIAVSLQYGKLKELGYVSAIEPIINGKTPDFILVNRITNDVHVIDVKTCPPKQHINFVGRTQLSRYIEKIVDKYLDDDKLWEYIINEYLKSNGIVDNKIKKSCILVVPSYCIENNYLIDDIDDMGNENILSLMEQGRLIIASIYNIDRDTLKLNVYKGKPGGCPLHRQLMQGLEINLEGRAVIFLSRNSPLEIVACFVLQTLLWFTKHVQKYEFTLNDIDTIMEGIEWENRPVVPPILHFLPTEERLNKWSDVLHLAVSKGLMRYDPIKGTYFWNGLRPGSPQSTYSKIYEKIHQLCEYAAKRYYWYFMG